MDIRREKERQVVRFLLPSSISSVLTCAFDRKTFRLQLGRGGGEGSLKHSILNVQEETEELKDKRLDLINPV